MLVPATGAAILIAWLARVSGVPLRTVLSIAAGAVALGWLILLVAVPWNLYFAARRVVAEQAVSRGRGITVRAERKLRPAGSPAGCCGSRSAGTWAPPR